MYAQEDPQAEDVESTEVSPENQSAESSALPMNRQQLELEIRTSTLSELAAWSRGLGLSEGGTKTELSRRLRNHFKLPELQEEGGDNRKIVTIESAQSTDYFRIEVIDEDYARLIGEVRISLKDNDSVHSIKANEILFNRTRNIITARGGVEYIKEQDDTTEIFRGSSITVNTDDWSSIFLDGDSEKKLEGEGAAYRFSGEVITRSTEDVMILKNAQISNANADEVFWSVNASKLWLLPGSDFAIFNAVLKVGEIPVLYIPFFYYPADEVIFHPVIGFRSREGSFAQTTTYILGRPKADNANASSISRILGNANDMEKRREGVFLRSTGKKSTDPNTTTLKAIFDLYSNLGAYFGFDFSTPKFTIFDAFDISLGLGLSRTISKVGDNWTPFGETYNELSDWNRSKLFTKDLPVRYRLTTKSSVSGKFGSLSWDLPLYSDPYMDYDFLNRAEDMDWFNMIQQGAALEGESTPETQIQSYQWQLNGSLRPTFQKLAPYISNISLSSFSMTLSFNQLKNIDPELRQGSPNLYFFAMDRATLFSLSGSITGAPLALGAGAAASSQAQQIPEFDDPFRGIGIPRSPWETETEAAAQILPENALIPPVLNQRFDLPKVGRLRFNINYQMSPTASSEYQFSSLAAEKGNTERQSILVNFGGNGNVNFILNQSENLFTNTVTFTGNGTWRDIYINEDAEEYTNDPNRADRERLQQYNQTFFTSTYANTSVVRPLYRNAVFSQSNVQYSFRGTLVKSKFTGTAEDPKWEFDWGTWEKEGRKDDRDIIGLTSHQFSTKIAANIMEKMQDVSLTADLPPFDNAISTNATFRVWISDTNARIRMTRPEDAEEWKYDPFYLTETLRLHTKSTLTYYMIAEVDPMKEYQGVTTITTSLTLWSFKASFSAVRMRPYYFEYTKDDDPLQGGKWVAEEEPMFVPRDLTFNYNHNFSNIDLIKNKIKFSTNISTSLLFDLQRHTNSNFNFTMGFTLNITNFLDLTFSSRTENAVIFRYFKNVPGMEELTKMYPKGEQNNVLTDLFDSFNFSDDAKRQRTGFKMKSFNLAATHHSGDWNAIMGITMSPFRRENSTKYEFNTDFSFLVQWVPISEIKTDIRYEKRTDTWTKQ